MEILNGTEKERDGPGAFTSFQRKEDDDDDPNKGKAVVDYLLFSRDFLNLVEPGSLQIKRVDRAWSDHAILAFHLTLPSSNHEFQNVPRGIPSEIAPLQPSLPTPCDILTAETIAAAQTDDEATLDLYGTIANVQYRHFTVHLSSLCRNQGRADARAAFGAYWGKDSRHNTGGRISGRQLDGRAMLVGVIYALEHLERSRGLDIFMTSKTIIRTICYAAGKNHTRGWDCANGDLLEHIAKIIRDRDAPISFHHICEPLTNAANAGARKLAVAAACA
ncbi:hypothetical protein B0H16DRAFT_1336859, partial [Mycena metata]